MTLHTKQFNVLLDKSERHMLAELAKSQRASSGFILRQLIARAYAMQYQNCPVCANGTPCFVPHMHHSRPNPLAHPTAQEPQS